MSLSDAQRSIAEDESRFRVTMAGRRFGKTYLAMRELAKFARQPKKRCWFIAPTRAQGKGIVWDELKARLGELNWVDKVNESDLTLNLVNGSEITIRSADAYDRMRGFAVDFVVFDEFADMDPNVWTAVRPTLSDRGGHALFIGTPKGVGNWSKDIWDLAGHSPKWNRWQYSTIDGGRVPQEELEAARAEMDERTFRQEYEATFETYSGVIYYAFNTDANVKPFDDDIGNQLLFGIDFNRNPISAVVAKQYRDYIHIFDEIVIYNSNTDELMQEMRTRYGNLRMTAYPDPAGIAQKTSAGGKSDITILENGGVKCIYPRRHLPVKDRINAVNSAFNSMSGNTKIYIDPRCKKTIECLNKQTYKPGTQLPDKDSGYDHQNDALGYLVSGLYPIVREREEQPNTRWSVKTR